MECGRFTRATFAPIDLRPTRERMSGDLDAKTGKAQKRPQKGAGETRRDRGLPRPRLLRPGDDARQRGAAARAHCDRISEGETRALARRACRAASGLDLSGGVSCDDAFKIRAVADA